MRFCGRLRAGFFGRGYFFKSACRVERIQIQIRRVLFFLSYRFGNQISAIRKPVDTELPVRGKPPGDLRALRRGRAVQRERAAGFGKARKRDLSGGFREIGGVKAVICKRRLAPLIHKHQQQIVRRVVFKVLYAVFRVAGKCKIPVRRRFGLLPVHGGLYQRRGARAHGGGVITQQHLMVVIVPVYVVIYAVSHPKALLPVYVPGRGREAEAVDTAAAVPVRGRLGVQIRSLAGIIGEHLRQIRGGHNAVRFGGHIRRSDLRSIEHGDIEPVFIRVFVAQRFKDIRTYGILFEFQRTVNAAVFGAEGNAAEVPHKPLHAADQVALQVELDETRGKRTVNIAVFFIHGDPLDVVPALPAGKDPVRERQ